MYHTAPSSRISGFLSFVAKKLHARVQGRDSDAPLGADDMQGKLEEPQRKHWGSGAGANVTRSFADTPDRAEGRRPDRALPVKSATILDPSTGRSVTISTKMRP
jgi:hypothetical protein